MKALKNIKKYYRPIQPTVKTESEKITYEEIRPTKEIEDFVYCFWQLKTQKKLDKPFVYQVVSDGCIDIFFDHKQPADNFVMGFCRKYTEFPVGKEFDYIGIRFLPAVFSLLFGVNAEALSNQSQELNKVLPNFSDWIGTTIKPLALFEEIAQTLNKKLITLLKQQELYCDQRFLDALIIIVQKNGHLNTEKELNTGISPRQLRRIFKFYIGTTAKSFSNVVRFQYILNTKPSKQTLKENKLYFDVGFFDQAHFIKNFKTFYGVAPSEAFG